MWESMEQENRGGRAGISRRSWPGGRGWGRAGGPAQRMGPGAPEGQPGPPGDEAWTRGGQTMVGAVGISETRLWRSRGGFKDDQEVLRSGEFRSWE